MRLALCAALCACACGDDASPAVAPAPAAARPAAAGHELVVWRTRVPTEPGVPVVTWQRGPEVDGGEVIVGSSIAGRVRLSVADGEVIEHVTDVDGSNGAPARGADLGVTNEVRLGGVRVTGADEVLTGYDGEHAVWRTGEDERYAYVDGALYAGDGLRAVAVDGGIGPVWLDPATGARERRGDAVAALHALGAAWSDAGALAVAVRLDASLRNDALVVFDARGNHAYTWHLPALDAPRVDPVGVAVGPGAEVFVFHDGAYAARLRAP